MFCFSLVLIKKNKKYKAAVAIFNKGIELGYTFTKGHVLPLVVLLKEMELPDYVHDVLTKAGLKHKEMHVLVQEWVEQRQRLELQAKQKGDLTKIAAPEDRDDELLKLTTKEEAAEEMLKKSEENVLKQQ